MFFRSRNKPHTSLRDQCRSKQDSQNENDGIQKSICNNYFSTNERPSFDNRHVMVDPKKHQFLRQSRFLCKDQVVLKE